MNILTIIAIFMFSCLSLISARKGVSMLPHAKQYRESPNKPQFAALYFVFHFGGKLLLYVWAFYCGTQAFQTH